MSAQEVTLAIADIAIDVHRQVDGYWRIRVKYRRVGSFFSEADYDWCPHLDEQGVVDQIAEDLCELLDLNDAMTWDQPSLF